MEADVREIDFRTIDQQIDLISGGPPCQPFSRGGNHGGPEDHRDMFPEAIRATRELRPAAFLFENVKGLTRPSFADYFRYIVLQLTMPELARRAPESWHEHLARLERSHAGPDDLHYRVTPCLLNAADYGVPQRRERVFVVGFRSDLGIEWTCPAPTHSLAALRWSRRPGGEYWARHAPANQQEAEAVDSPFSFVGTTSLRPWRTVRDAIADLPDPEFHPGLAAGISHHRFQPGARGYAGHNGSVLDDPAKTLKAGDHGVPGGENMLVRPDGSTRYFSLREAARLQTFPDEFVFAGSWTETMRQVGNAVPVALATVMATSIREQLDATQRWR
jgi:DNA (cytosine-5)-methyltransferase 1